MKADILVGRVAVRSGSNASRKTDGAEAVRRLQGISSGAGLALYPRPARPLRAFRWLFASTTAVMALLALPRQGIAGPVGGTVVEGAAGISQAGAVTTINQSTNRAIINWQGFSVGASETVNFNQPSAASATLNRVTGSDASVIAGSLNANGQVFLVNPNGVLFSKGSQVNVGGLVASTLDISNADFMAGRYVFEGTSQAAVVNQGRLHAHSGGYISLLGKTVSNDGVIAARLGTVAMASGEKITLNFDGNSLLDVTIDKGALNALVENKRAIKADGGTVILTAKAADQILSAQVNNSGVIQARTMASLRGGASSGVAKTGKIKLLADGGTVTSSGKLDASAPKGGKGGSVTVAASGGTAMLSGKIDASSARDTGGTVIVTGTNVDLQPAAIVNADGTIGGTILIGGDRHGGSDANENFVSTAVANATTTTIAVGATLSANGSNGNGGNIVVWSDGYTDFEGAISATGAGTAGNGGFAEVSSAGVLDYNGAANLLSANGVAGTLLLDPYNITISNSGTVGGGSLDGGSPTNSYNPTGTSIIRAATIASALQTADVVIYTGGAGSPGGDAGNITITGVMNVASGSHALTLIAANNISSTTTSSNIFWGGTGLTLNAGGSISLLGSLGNSGPGPTVLTVTAGGNISLANLSLGNASSSITSTTGNIALNGTVSWSQTSALFQATQGSITSVGSWTPSNSSGSSSSSVITMNAASINLNGTMNLYYFNGFDSPVDNFVSTSLVVKASTGNITTGTINLGAGSVQLTATAGSVNTGPFNRSVTLNGVTRAATGGSLTINAGTDVNINGATNVGDAATSISASRNININGVLNWSNQTLALNAAKNIYVGADITGTGNDVGISARFGSGFNADGSAMGLYQGFVANGGYGKIWLPDNAAVTINGTTYATITTQAQFDAIGSNPSGNYVLLADFSNMSFSELQPFNLANSSRFTGSFYGFGHSLTLVASSITPTSVFSLSGLYQANVVLPVNGTINVSSIGGASAGGMFTIAASGDINVTSPLTFTSGTHALVAGGDLNIDAPVTLAGGGFVAAATNDVNVNVSMSDSSGILAFAGTNIYVSAGNVLTVNGTGSLVLNTGTGLNIDGTNQGLHLAGAMDGAFTSRIDISSATDYPLTINKINYTIIDSLSELASVNASGGMGSYALGANLSAATDTSSGYNISGSVITTLLGNLNGLGHTIDGLTIAGGALVGTFGSSSITTGTISNLGLINLTITGTSSGIGGIVGTSYGTVADDFVISTTGAGSGVNGSNYIGGLVGVSNGSIFNSYADVQITTNSGSVGGLAGTNAATSWIINSHTAGSITETGSGSSIGGLIGINYGFISNSYADVPITATANTSATQSAIGGLVGTTSGWIINGSHATGSITIVTNGGVTNIGGLVGQQNTSARIYSTSDGTVGGTVAPIYATGNVSITVPTDANGNPLAATVNQIGGLVGFSDTTAVIYNVSASGNVTVTNNNIFPNSLDYDVSESDIGGLIGKNSSTLTNGTYTGTVTAVTGAYVGGIAGRNTDTLTNVVAKGGSVSGYKNVGGIAGYNSGMISNDTTVALTTEIVIGNQSGNSNAANVGGAVGDNGGALNYVNVSGAVFGSINVGGLVGINEAGGSSYAGGIINGGSASGQVNASGNDVGGFIGNNGGSTTNGTASGNVFGTDYVGGFIGYNSNATYSIVIGPTAYGSVTAAGANHGPLLGGNNGGASASVAINVPDFVVTNGDAPWTATGIGAVTLMNQLQNGSYTLTSSYGNIDVNADVSWSANTLTLSAAQNVFVNAVMKESGTANLVVVTGSSYNADGTKMGLYFPSTNGVFAGRIDISSTASAVTTRTVPLKINDDVYTIITSLNDAAIANNLASINNGTGYYALGADLKASSDTGANYAFSGNLVANMLGTLNGLGHTIDGLNIAGGSLIGTIGSTAVRTASVTNLGVMNLTITGTGGGIGGIAGTNEGLITYDFVTTTAAGISGANYIGGLIGTNGINSYPGMIINSYANVRITATGGSVGGLVGYQRARSWISNSVADGSITDTSGSPNAIGGLAGNNYGTISNSGANVAVNVNSPLGSVTYVGGLVGYNGNVGAIINGAWAKGAVTVTASSASQVGGLVGENDSGGLIYGTNDGTSGGTVATIYETGDVTITIPNGASGSASNIGGLIGQNNAESEINYVAASGNVTINNYKDLPNDLQYDPGESNIGGLVGSNSGTLSYGAYTGSVTATKALNVGGIVGWNSGGAVSNVSASGGTISGYGNVGGIAGFNGTNGGGIAIIANATTANETVIGSTNTSDFHSGSVALGVGSNQGTVSGLDVSGTVNGGNNVGGQVGTNSAGSNGVTTGTVYGGTVHDARITGTGDNVGGDIGSNGGKVFGGAVTNTSVSGHNNVGGIIGSNLGGANVVGVTFGNSSVSATGPNFGTFVGSNSGSVASTTFVETPPPSSEPSQGNGAQPQGNNDQDQRQTNAAAQRAAANAGGAIVSAALNPETSSSPAGNGVGAGGFNGQSPATLDADIEIQQLPARPTGRSATGDNRRRRTASRTHRNNGSNLGATIRSIEVDGQRFDLQAPASGSGAPGSSRKP